MNKKKREHILQEAEKLFNRFGIKKTAVDEIAKYARVAKGTIYNYFGDKEGILREVLNEKIVFFETVLDTTLQSIKDPVERLRRTLMERLKISLDTPFLSDAVLYEDAKDNIRMMNDRLDESARKTIDVIINEGGDRVPEKEKHRLLNLITYTLRGIDEAIRNRIRDVRQENIEKDIDYLVKIILPERKNRNGGRDV